METEEEFKKQVDFININEVLPGLVGLSDTERNKTLNRLLNRAYKIRDFEIKLFWQRALYFWGFIVGTFTAYFYISDSSKTFTIPHLKLLVACIGLILSYSWYLVNRASFHWKMNWEAIIDLIEDELKLPLYRLNIMDEIGSETDILSRKHFWISKINTIVCVVICGVWVFLILSYLLPLTFGNCCLFAGNKEFFSGFEIVAVILVTLYVIGFLYSETHIAQKPNPQKEIRYLHERDSEVQLFKWKQKTDTKI